MGQALYRKYRSKSLDEVVGQEHVTKTLQNAIKSGKISHAYLFTGPKGVGKTSIARILAHEVNQLPYEDTTTHLDIIEIDAASNRRIDEIRDLRDKIHISPTSAKYKVYIIDEVHMLTKEAFNALLKTLEEPPAHVIFILATTEAHKLPETIVSRTQRYAFKPISQDSAVLHLKSIAKSEGLKVDDDALALIAEHGDGSMRDSISLLDQAASNQKHVSLDDVRRMLGIVPEEAIKSLIETLENGSPGELLNTVKALRDQGYQAASVAKQLGQALRDQLLNHTNAIPSKTVTELLRQLLLVPPSSNPERMLEIVLLEVAITNQTSSEDTVRSPEPAIKPVPEPKRENLKPKAEEKLAEPENNVTVKSQADQGKMVAFNLSKWPEILETLKTQHSTLYSVLRMCDPVMDGDTLVLSFHFSFHQKQMKDTKNQEKLLAVIRTICLPPASINCITDTTIKAPKASKPPKKPNDSIDAISNIFGGAEVLES